MHCIVIGQHKYSVERNPPFLYHWHRRGKKDCRSYKMPTLTLSWLVFFDFAASSGRLANQQPKNSRQVYGTLGFHFFTSTHKRDTRFSDQPTEVNFRECKFFSNRKIIITSATIIVVWHVSRNFVQGQPQHLMKKRQCSASGWQEMPKTNVGIHSLHFNIFHKSSI